jgi:hypothetical protein
MDYVITTVLVFAFLLGAPALFLCCLAGADPEMDHQARSPR